MKSIAGMLEQLESLLETRDLNAWEKSFVEHAVTASRYGTRTSLLNERQVLKVEEIWRKHFAG